VSLVVDLEVDPSGQHVVTGAPFINTSVPNKGNTEVDKGDPVGHLFATDHIREIANENLRRAVCAADGVHCGRIEDDFDDLCSYKNLTDDKHKECAKQAHIRQPKMKNGLDNWLLGLYDLHESRKPECGQLSIWDAASKHLVGPVMLIDRLVNSSFKGLSESEVIAKISALLLFKREKATVCDADRDFPAEYGYGYGHTFWGDDSHAYKMGDNKCWLNKNASSREAEITRLLGGSSTQVVQNAVEAWQKLQKCHMDIAIEAVKHQLLDPFRSEDMASQWHRPQPDGSSKPACVFDFRDYCSASFGMWSEGNPLSPSQSPLSAPPRGGQASLAFSYANRFCMGRLYGRAGRLTAQKWRFPARAVTASTSISPSLSSTYARARPGRLSALSVPQLFPMKLQFVWGFCMGAQGA
jgi:hypothetical protein